MSGMENNFSLVRCMEEVPDPRAPYNQKHKFLDIIVIAVTAILCGMDTWNEIEDWAKSKRDWLGSFLELPGGIPSHDTINRVFRILLSLLVKAHAETKLLPKERGTHTLRACGG